MNQKIQLVNTQNSVSNYQANPTSVDSFWGRTINFIPTKSNLVVAQNVEQPTKSQVSDLFENVKEIKALKLNDKNLAQPSNNQTPIIIKEERVDDELTINPPELSDFDIESDTEEEYGDKDSKIKTEKEKTITWVPANAPSQAKVTSKKSIRKKKVETTNLIQPENYQATRQQ